jgi:hypothetical protein
VASVLPPHRVLKASKLDPDTDPKWFFSIPPRPDHEHEQGLADEEANEKRYERFFQAITQGQVLRCHAKAEDAFGANKEVSLTKYSDPETSEPRYAVEVWNGLDDGKHDFASYETARQRLLYYLDKIGPLPLAAS